ALANKVWALLGSYQGGMGVSWGSPWFQPKRLGSFPPATKEAWAFLDLTKEVWAFLGFSLDGIAKEAWFLLDIQRSLDVPRFLNRAWTFLDSSIALGRSSIPHLCFDVALFFFGA